ncbi:MAG: hypothetical protein WBG62_11900, partial [Cyclobacteriaceae bacterium]
AGFTTRDGLIIDNLKEDAKNAGLQEANIIVFCGSDEDYQHNARKLIEKFRSGCKGKLLVLAGPPEALSPDDAELLDYLIHRNSNAPDILNRMQDQILDTPNKKQKG